MCATQHHAVGEELHMMAAANGRCPCHLPLNPPADVPHWWTSTDPEPPEHVRVVARYGQSPDFLRMERDPAGGWRTRGAAASHLDLDDAPEPWATVGECWARTPHPVVNAT